MMIGTKRLHRFAVLWLFLIGPTAAPAQQPVGESPIGAADLFRSAEKPPGVDPFQAASRPKEVGQEIERHLEFGKTCSKEQRYAEAEVQFAAAIALAERLEVGRYHLVHALFCQATLMARLARFDESRILIERAVLDCLEIWSYSDDQLDYMFRMTTQVYRESKRMSDLEPVYRKLCDLEVFCLGDGHPQVARHANDLGDYLTHQGKIVEAEEVFSGRLAIVEKHHGLEASELDEALERLLRFYGEVSKEAEAERVVEAILAKRETQLGPNHAKLAETLVTRADLLRKAGRTEEADASLARAVGIRCRNAVVGLVASRRVSASIGLLSRPGA